MNPEYDPWSPESVEQSFLVEIRSLCSELKKKHARRKRSPLIFIKTFLEAERRLQSTGKSGWESVDKEFIRAKTFLESLRADYLLWLDPAERQREKNKFWDLLYKAPPSLLEGGRADGNSC